ncbi:hypothetical protein ABW20_dc0102040 [Dactylellina cionopaga]|nr:hypothetical protein ABW20_dc0102040 [Dactylellina cionopaga]
MLSFTFRHPENIFGERVGDDALVSKFHHEVLNIFRIFKGGGIIYEGISGLSTEHAEMFLAFFNQPIVWLRAEILQIVDLVQWFTKPRGALDEDQDVIEDFCRWLLMNNLVESKGRLSYSEIQNFSPRVDDLYPLLPLRQVHLLSCYNLYKDYFILAEKWGIPKGVEVVDPIGIYESMISGLEMIVQVDLGVEPEQGQTKIRLLNTDQISRLYHLQAIISIYDGAAAGSQSAGSQDALRCLRKAIECATGDTKELLGSLADVVTGFIAYGESSTTTDEVSIIINTQSSKY